MSDATSAAIACSEAGTYPLTREARVSALPLEEGEN